MLPTSDSKPTQQISWDQRLLRNAARPKAALKPEYQELKFTLHRKLLDKINLEALATIDNQRVRGEVRQALITLIDDEPTLLSSLEKQQISEEVLDEVFGLGPLEPLLQDPTISDILVNTHKQVYVERKGLLELTNVALPRRRAPAADHRQDRLAGGPARGRIHPHGGRPADRRLARQRHHSAAGRGRAAALHPPFRTDKLMPAGPGGAQSDDPGHDGAARSGREGAAEHHHRGRHRLRQDDAAQRVCPSSFRPKERIVTIEDAAELQLKQPHVARLETRPPNLEGHGAVRQRELLVNSLRMRPDRIVVGEVRGEEALDMLQAMNTGHDGSLTTIHANTPRDAVCPSGGDGFAGQRQHAVGLASASRSPAPCTCSCRRRA